MTDTMRESRPGVLTFVGIVLYIKAGVAAITGVAVLLQRNDDPFQSATGQSADELLVAAIAEFVVAMLLFAAASGIMWGAPWSRLFVAIVLGIRLVVATYWLITHTGGGFQWSGVISAGIAIFVLWALYGNEQSQRYFAAYQ